MAHCGSRDGMDSVRQGCLTPTAYQQSCNHMLNQRHLDCVAFEESGSSAADAGPQALRSASAAVWRAVRPMLLQPLALDMLEQTDRRLFDHVEDAVETAFPAEVRIRHFALRA